MGWVARFFVGARARARLEPTPALPPRALTSPRYFCTNSDPTTRMKDAVVWWATALASIVLPVPGGP